VAPRRDSTEMARLMQRTSSHDNAAAARVIAAAVSSVGVPSERGNALTRHATAPAARRRARLWHRPRRHRS
jgi:hypothetical protein